MLISLIQGVVRSLDECLSPFDQGGGKKSRDCTENHFLKKRGVHLGPMRARPMPLVPTAHQNPHSFVFMIQRPRRRFVTEWAKMHEERLLVRYATTL